MAAGGGQELAAGKDSGTRRPRSREGPAPGHVHPISGPATTHRRYSRLDHSGHQILAEIGGDLGHGGPRRHRMLGVDVHIPQSGQQVGALQVDHPVTGRAGRRSAVTHIEDAAVFELATEGGTLEVRFDGFSASAETLP